jgi:hypothetical protein
VEAQPGREVAGDEIVGADPQLHREQRLRRHHRARELDQAGLQIGVWHQPSTSNV